MCASVVAAVITAVEQLTTHSVTDTIAVLISFTIVYRASIYSIAIAITSWLLLYSTFRHLCRLCNRKRVCMAILFSSIHCCYSCGYSTTVKSTCTVHMNYGNKELTCCIYVQVAKEQRLHCVIGVQQSSKLVEVFWAVVEVEATVWSPCKVVNYSSTSFVQSSCQNYLWFTKV